MPPTVLELRLGWVHLILSPLLQMKRLRQQPGEVKTRPSQVGLPGKPTLACRSLLGRVLRIQTCGREGEGEAGGDRVAQKWKSGCDGAVSTEASANVAGTPEGR